MLVLTRTEIEGLISPGALIDAVADGFRAVSSGEMDAPPRQGVAGDGGTVLTMPGRRAGGPVVVKLVGLFPGRDRDKTIAGLIHGRFGSDYAGTIELTGSSRPTHETVLELAHRFQLTKFAYIQPDVQFVARPGGTGNIDNAVVVGAQVGISF